MSRFNDPREERRSGIRNLWPQRRSAYCRNLLKSVLRDCRALESGRQSVFGLRAGL